jgi:hypothetical protein
VGEVLHYLELLNEGPEYISWKSQWMLAAALKDELKVTTTANYVPIKFVGGPPTAHDRTRTYKGSLFTLLLDRILESVRENGLESTEYALGLQCLTLSA